MVRAYRLSSTVRVAVLVGGLRRARLRARCKPPRSQSTRTAVPIDVRRLSDAILLTCGNGHLDQTEQCDDGNTTPGDGCNQLCQQEGQLGVHDARSALRLHCRLRQRAPDLGRGVRRRQQGFGRRLLRRLQDRRARLAVPRARQEVRPAVRRRRDDRHRRNATTATPPAATAAPAPARSSRARAAPRPASPASSRCAATARSRPARSATAEPTRRICRPGARGRTACSTATAPAARRPAPRSRSAAEPPEPARHTRARPVVATATSRPARTATTATWSTVMAARSTCKLEGGFTCKQAVQPDTQACTQSINTGDCLELPVKYRDFKNETLAGGHPDFFYYGATITPPITVTNVQVPIPGTTNGTSMTAPTFAFNKRYCVPNSCGPAKQNDSTARCWDIAQANLDANGRPAFNPRATAAVRTPPSATASSPTSATTPTAATSPATARSRMGRSMRSDT